MADSNDLGGERRPQPEEAPRPDLGTRSEALPPALRHEYYVETDNEREVVDLIAKRTERIQFLIDAAPAIHACFGCDARLMLGTLWRLKDPIGPVLRLFVYTQLDSNKASAAMDCLRASWLSAQPDVGLKIVVTRI